MVVPVASAHNIGTVAMLHHDSGPRIPHKTPVEMIRIWVQPLASHHDTPRWDNFRRLDDQISMARSSHRNPSAQDPGAGFVSTHCLAEREQTGEASSRAGPKLVVQHMPSHTDSHTHHVTPSIKLLRDERSTWGSDGRGTAPP